MCWTWRSLGPGACVAAKWQWDTPDSPAGLPIGPAHSTVPGPFGGASGAFIVRSGPLTVTLIPGDETACCPSAVYHLIDEPALTLPGSTDELLDSTGSAASPKRHLSPLPSPISRRAAASPACRAAAGRLPTTSLHTQTTTTRNASNHRLRRRTPMGRAWGL